MKKLIVGSDYSGVGAFDQALIRNGINYKKVFACDFDYFARLTYILNFGNDTDLILVQSKESGGVQPYQQNRVYDINGIMPALNAELAGRNNILLNEIKYGKYEEQEDLINIQNINSSTRRGRVGKGVSQTLDMLCQQVIYTKQRIRKLTPTECFRLMDFNPEMIEKTIYSGLISDSQLYKQAGNSICVGVLALLIKKLLK